MTMRRLLARHLPTSLLVAGLSFVVGHAGAASSSQHKAHRAAPTFHETAPDSTATIAARAPARPATDDKPGDETLPAPFRLPTASRARVRDCGLKWQAMKMSGDAGDDIWRDFASRCLAAANGPLDKR